MRSIQQNKQLLYQFYFLRKANIPKLYVFPSMKDRIEEIFKN